ncbi:MAG: hypothetical protein P1U86_08495 [Verrucomicrobiales bacterium]|nr:hypothetical protein [Verrucomicrobiales bacterium]
MRSYPVRYAAAFSLVEVTISIAIVAAVLLPLLAILSQGGGRVTDSEDRFAATRIIQSIESEIRYSQEKSAFFIGSESDSQSGSVKDILVPASSATRFYLGYDRSAKLIREISKGEFSTGIQSSDTEILYLVELKFSKAGTSSGPGVPALYRIQFSVEQPAFTAEKNRSRERLQTLLSGQ